MRQFLRLIAGIYLMLIADSTFAQNATLVPNLYLREGPSRDHQALGFTQGEVAATILSTSGSWSLIQLRDGRQFYAHNSGIRSSGGSAAPSAQPSAGAATGTQASGSPTRGQVFFTKEDNWPMRNRPGTEAIHADSRINYYMSDDVPLTFVEARDDDGDRNAWYKVQFQYQGAIREAWISENRLRSASASETEACNCSVPGAQGDGSITQQAQNIAGVAAGDSTGVELSGVPPACDRFISRDGIGDLGALMIEAAGRVAPGCMYGTNVFQSLCDNYMDLEREDQNTFLAILFGHLAADESSCEPSATNGRASNGRADGLFQLEYSNGLRANGNRSREWCSPGVATDTLALGFQANCTVATIEQINCNITGSITSSFNYWQKLQGTRSDVVNRIRADVQRWGRCN